MRMTGFGKPPLGQADGRRAHVRRPVARAPDGQSPDRWRRDRRASTARAASYASPAPTMPASFSSAATTVVSPRSRAAAARCRATSRPDATTPRRAPPATAFDSAGRGPRRVVAWTIRQMRPRFTGRSRSRAFDVVAQEVRPVHGLLHDAAIHVDDVERAVGAAEQVHRPEALVPRREDLSLRIAVDRAQAAGAVVQDPVPVDEVRRRVGDERVAVAAPAAADRRDRSPASRRPGSSRTCRRGGRTGRGSRGSRRASDVSARSIDCSREISGSYRPRVRARFGFLHVIVRRDEVDEQRQHRSRSGIRARRRPSTRPTARAGSAAAISNLPFFERRCQSCSEV